jgi:hypothetical protein
MAGINITVHLEYDEVVERLKAEGWVVPVRCKDCKWFGLVSCAIQIVDDTDGPSEDDFCSFGERKGGDE